jgi:hypothetical protein
VQKVRFAYMPSAIDKHKTPFVKPNQLVEIGQFLQEMIKRERWQNGSQK